MRKRTMLLAGMILCLLLFVTVAVSAETTADVTISTAEEFLAFAENCRLDSYSRDLTVALTADIDLTGKEFAGIPIFGGTFEGNNHTISGLSITANGSSMGLFRYLTETAVVRDLQVAGKVMPQGSRGNVGGIAGNNAGKLQNCGFLGEVSGSDRVGGIAGVNSVTGVIEHCTVAGAVGGSHFVGGLAGENQGVIRDSQSAADVNTTAQQNTVDISDITLGTLTGAEAANAATDIGGIAGTNTGTIRSCVNRGNVGYQHMGYNVGGIAGSQTGYIVDCVNYGAVSGRKEVGGIAGQAEPSILLEYETDTLQLLRAEMAVLADLADRAAANAQGNTTKIRNLLATLEKYIADAEKAMDTLTIDPENPHLEDWDTYVAALQTLNSSISGVDRTLRSLKQALQDTTADLEADINAIAQQVEILNGILDNAQDHLGGSVTDVSDMDTQEDLSSKLQNCENHGRVQGDLNAGGIVGAIAIENDLDHEADVQLAGDTSLNIAGQLRSVVVDCINRGAVTVKRRNAGGIVGWQSFGLVKNCGNVGDVQAEAADYAGGITGQGSGYIRDSFAQCAVSGDAYVGGIAGSATEVSGCYSVVLITGREKLGGILGWQIQGYELVENYYLPVAKDVGAVDGISYSGSAQPMPLADFLAQEALPELLKTITVTFQFADGVRQTMTVALGGSLAAEQIPAVPEKAGFVAKWDGMSQEKLTNLLFDVTFQAVYTSHGTTIETDAVRENGRPVLLVQGNFLPDAQVVIQPTGAFSALQQGRTLLQAWEIAVSGAETVTAGRWLVPSGQKTDGLKLYVQKADGQWQQVSYTIDGSYLVFELELQDQAIALVQEAPALWPWIAAGAAVVLLTALVMVLLARRKKVKATEALSSPK